jgi:hypothetical protein
LLHRSRGRDNDLRLRRLRRRNLMHFLLESLESLAHSLSDLGKLTGTEDDQHDDQNNDQL